MHTLSSASRTCMASSSAVECTATDATPSSLQARSTRRAISPRFAISILSNIAGCRPSTELVPEAGGGCLARVKPEGRLFARHALFDDHQRLTEFDRLAVFDQNLDHGSGARGGNLIHGLHRLHDHESIARA